MGCFLLASVKFAYVLEHDKRNRGERVLVRDPPNEKAESVTVVPAVRLRTWLQVRSWRPQRIVAHRGLEYYVVALSCSGTLKLSAKADATFLGEWLELREDLCHETAFSLPAGCAASTSGFSACWFVRLFVRHAFPPGCMDDPGTSFSPPRQTLFWSSAPSSSSFDSSQIAHPFLTRPNVTASGWRGES